MTDQKMNPEIKEQWLDALRSGKYPQGVGYLRYLDGGGVEHFCCLGVLCDLAVKAGLDLDVGPGRPIITNGRYFNYDETNSVLPKKVMRWAGLPDVDPEIDGEEVVVRDRTLASLNDSGVTFTEIADLIEQHL